MLMSSIKKFKVSFGVLNVILIPIHFREVHYVSENGRIEGLILEENSAENLSSTDLHSHDSGEDIETDNQEGVHGITNE